jgi:REP element-mobilizing transposase RayT
MARHWRIRYAGAKYHLTGRGNGREVVFVTTHDYERFLAQLAAALAADEVVLYAYVLMPNHYHLFVETPLGNVQRFMQRLNTAYGMYFRYKHRRPGHCFQGRYGAEVVGGDDYVLRLTRYLHLNPVKTRRYKDKTAAEKRSVLEGYVWSSYRGYAELAPAEEMVNYRWLTLMGRRRAKANRAAYRRYVEQMLGAEDEVLSEAMGRSAYAIGDERFVAETEEDIRSARLAKTVNGGDVVWPEKPRKPIEAVANAVLGAVGLSAEDLRRHGRAVGERKGMAIELLCRYSSASQREVARFIGCGQESMIGKQRRVLRERVARDPAFARSFETSAKRVMTAVNASF